ncbi:MAG TPA: hypothetical protein VGJ91_23170 [Polyangiaceae bacterium]
MSAPKLSPAAQLQQLIEQAKSVRPVSPAARVRVLKRAQSSALAASALGPANPSVPVRESWSRAWIGGAAGATLLAAAAALALHGRNEASALGPAPVQSGANASLNPALVVSSFGPELGPAASASAVQPSTTRQSPRPSESNAPEPYAGELELLRRAHAAYGSGDFANALRLLAAHGRRFPNGRLAEEREALRVRALSSSGQTDSARRAAQALASRFPRSVLLSRTMSAADAGQ